MFRWEREIHVRMREREREEREKERDKISELKDLIERQVTT